MNRLYPFSVIFFLALFGSLGYVVANTSWNLSKSENAPAITKPAIISKKSHQDAISLPKTCYKNPKVAIYMYHYVRPDAENTPDSTPYKLSLEPAVFARQMHYLKKLESDGKIAILFFSELEKYERSDCFPNKQIVLLTSDDGWDDTYRHILPIIKKEQIKFHTALIVNRIATDTKRIDTFMTKSEVQKVLASPYFEALSHTYSHPELPKSDEKNLLHELCDSKKNLEKMFGVSINTIVYPVGHDTPEVEKVAKECGYHYGLAIKNKDVILDGSQNNLELTRLRINREKSDPETTFRAILPKTKPL